MHIQIVTWTAIHYSMRSPPNSPLQTPNSPPGLQPGLLGARAFVDAQAAVEHVAAKREAGRRHQWAGQKPGLPALRLDEVHRRVEGTEAERDHEREEVLHPGGVDRQRVAAGLGDGEQRGTET